MHFTSISTQNSNDSTTVEEVVGSLAKTTTQDTKRIVVMDAGFYSKSNVNWLKSNGFDYITVLPSGDSKFESTSSEFIDYPIAILTSTFAFENVKILSQSL